MDQHVTATRALADNWLSERYRRTLQRDYTNIRLLEPLITADMRNLSETLGTSFSGLEYSVKTASSIEDKMERVKEDRLANNKPYDAEMEFLGLKDLVRYTEICNHDDIFKVAKQTIRELEDNDYVLSGVSNYYLKPFDETGYQGLHLNFISPYGQEIELQVHSEESFEAKQRGHSLYESLRQVSSSVDDKDKMKEMINKIHSAVKKPKNYYSLDTFKLPNKQRLIAQRKERVYTDIEANKDNPFVDSSKTPYAMTYSIYFDDKLLLSGFENVYTDRSVRSYQNDIEHNTCIYASITNSGKEIVTHTSPAKNITLTQAMDIAKKAERSHAAYMKDFYARLERDENIADRSVKRPEIEQVAQHKKGQEIDR